MGREEGGGFRMGNTCFKIIKLKIKKKIIKYIRIKNKTKQNKKISKAKTEVLLEEIRNHIEKMLYKSYQEIINQTDPN